MTRFNRTNSDRGPSAYRVSSFAEAAGVLVAKVSSIAFISRLLRCLAIGAPNASLQKTPASYSRRDAVGLIAGKKAPAFATASTQVPVLQAQIHA